MNLEGELIFHFLNTVVLTALVSWVVLWRYRVNVLEGMRSASGVALVLPGSAPGRPVTPEQRVGALPWERRARRRIGLALLAAVAVPGLILAVLHLYVSNLPMTPAHALLVAGALPVAAVPMAAASLALPLRRSLLLTAGVLVAGAVLATLVSIVQRLFLGRDPSLDQLLNFFTFFHFAAVWLPLPLMLVFLTGMPRIRGVAPIAFAGLMIFGLAPLLGSRLTAWLSSGVEGSRMLISIGLDGAFLAIALPTGLLAWWRLKRLADAYEAKRLSDVQLLARTWWLMFCASIALELVNAAPARSILVLVVTGAAYALFPWFNARFLAMAHIDEGRPPRRTLLLLRVFGYVARTEKLFDRIGARWRLFGPVTMIAAPDVVARTIDPGDFLRFASGRLAANFVTSRADLDARLAGMDLAPDPDGRYRVVDFCCRDDTWRATVVELMHRADAVLMDLRGLTTDRGGCSFELEQLYQRLPAERVVLVVDGDTDQQLIRTAMPLPPRMIALEKGTQAETDAVFTALLAAAELQPQLAG